MDPCGTVLQDGKVVAREVIYHIARHEDGDVQLSYEHFGSKESAARQMFTLLSSQPGTYSIVKYVKDGE